MNKIDELMKHIGWEQVSDIHAADEECELPPSTGDCLAVLLLENAQNQTGILISAEEDKEILEKIKSIYS
jgi:hypothetical protein